MIKITVYDKDYGEKEIYLNKSYVASMVEIPAKEESKCYSDYEVRILINGQATVDKYEDKVGKYLVKVMSGELDATQNKSVNKFLHAITDFERISDHALNIAGNAREKHEKSIVFIRGRKKKSS